MRVVTDFWKTFGDFTFFIFKENLGDLGVATLSDSTISTTF